MPVMVRASLNVAILLQHQHNVAIIASAKNLIYL